VRLLLTNDDGIDSVGLHVLARRMREFGDVVIVAPDHEYSGAGAALGALHLIQPEVRRVRVDGIEEAWSVSGPPALCVMFARLGAFGEPFDLVVSGINPGANVGRAVYHSGTVGACLTARNGGVSGVAVSQSVVGFGVEGQAWDDMLVGQQWETAAHVAADVVGALCTGLPAEPVVVNLNVPNVAIDELSGWQFGTVGRELPRRMARAQLAPLEGHADAFRVEMTWGQAVDLPDGTDGGLIERGVVSVSLLGRIGVEEREDVPGLASALTASFGPPRSATQT
jgi:5'-nucleotidase